MIDNRLSKEEHIEKLILEKMEIVIPGINNESTIDIDLKVSQIIQLLSEAYTNLKGEL